MEGEGLEIQAIIRDQENTQPLVQNYHDQDPENNIETRPETPYKINKEEIETRIERRMRR